MYTVGYMLACVPMALSIAYKERVLRTQPMDGFYVNAWYAITDC
jgi:hypothetical protein